MSGSTILPVHLLGLAPTMFDDLLKILSSCLEHAVRSQQALAIVVLDTEVNSWKSHKCFPSSCHREISPSFVFEYGY
jgi:hypothetical protein